MKKKLIDLFPNWPENGIFSALSDAASMPWGTDPVALDIDYIGGYSGNKPISPLVTRLLTSEGALTASGLASLVSVIIARYLENWGRAWTALFSDYDPIKNYDMEESENSADGERAGESISDTVVINDETAESESDIFGLNSGEEGAPAAHAKTVSSGGRSTTGSRNSETSRLANRVLRRSGNIGVTSSQQLIESELALRRVSFFESVYKDLDEVLTTPIYGGECFADS